jgi:hypothetical protein
VVAEWQLRQREAAERSAVEREVAMAPTTQAIESIVEPTPEPTPEPEAPEAVAVPDETSLEVVGEISPSNRRIYLDHPDFGYRHAPLRRATEVRRHEEEGELYRATYTTDAVGRRVTPRPAAAERGLLFVGCSFTFGLGVNDDETMPWQFGKAVPDLAVYNYGVAGYGPQHTLELAKLNLAAEVRPRRVTVVYTYIRDHLKRAVGTRSLVKWYAGKFPWYELDNAGRPERLGVFSDRHTAKPSGSRLLERFREWEDDEVNGEDAKLAAAILDEARLQFERQFDAVDFYVLIYPHVQDETTDLVVTHLRTISDGRIRILDYRNLLNGEGGPPWFIKEDPHPAAPLHRKVAIKLAEDLGGG